MLAFERWVAPIAGYYPDGWMLSKRSVGYQPFAERSKGDWYRLPNASIRKVGGTD